MVYSPSSGDLICRIVPSNEMRSYEWSESLNSFGAGGNLNLHPQWVTS